MPKINLQTPTIWILVICFLSIFNYQLSIINYAYAQSPAITCDDTKEACAQEFINNFTTPTVLENPKIEPNLLQKIQQALIDLKDKLIFWEQPKDTANLYSEGVNNFQNQVPLPLVPTGDNYLENIKFSLGHKGSPKTGFYTLTEPEMENIQKGEVKEFERIYEDSRFPTGICPVTGQC